MFFDTWWQGLIFGIVTTVGMLAVAYPFALRFQEFERSDYEKHKACKFN